MAKTQEVVPTLRVIESAKRLNNSVNGNPRFRVRFTDGSVSVTMSDASAGYDIQNLLREPETLVLVTFTRAGLIRFIQRADGSPA